MIDPFEQADGAEDVPCICENSCLDAAWDGVCDDGGPGYAYRTCALGTDCADCGGRAGPIEAFNTTNNDMDSALQASLDVRLLTAQISKCVPNHADVVCPHTNGCHNIGLSGASAAVELGPEPIGSYCHERNAYDWVGATGVAAATIQCQARFHDDELMAVQVSPRGCGADSGSRCFVCCLKPTSPSLPPFPSPPPLLPSLALQTAHPCPPAAPPSFGRLLFQTEVHSPAPDPGLAAALVAVAAPPVHSIGRRLIDPASVVTVAENGTSVILRVAERLAVITGRYDPTQPDKAGAKFQFVMRDVDGLPVVSETFDFRQRIDDFRVELVRSGHETKPTPLRMYFIGNKALGADGTYVPLRGEQRAPRSMDGRVEVIVELEHTGQHHVQLRGPQGDVEFQLLPWAVEVRAHHIHAYRRRAAPWAQPLDVHAAPRIHVLAGHRTVL